MIMTTKLQKKTSQSIHCKRGEIEMQMHNLRFRYHLDVWLIQPAGLGESVSD